MPISRYPSLQSKPADSTKTDNAEAEGAKTAEASRRNPEAAILDPDRLPSWQRPFVLGPNVRFTRTPHRKHPEPGMAAADDPEDVAFGPQLPSPATALQERIAEELPAARPGAEDIEALREESDDLAEDILDRAEEGASMPWYLSPDADTGIATADAAIETGGSDSVSAEPDPATAGMHEELIGGSAVVSEADVILEEAEDDVFSYLPDGLAFEMMALGGTQRRPAERRAQKEGHATIAPQPVAPAEALEETMDAVLMTAPWTASCTAAQDDIETVVNAVEPSTGDRPSPVALYRQVLLHSPVRAAAAAIAEAPEAPPACDDSAEETAPVMEHMAEAEAEAEADESTDSVHDEVFAPQPVNHVASVSPLNVLAKHEETDFIFPSIELLQQPRTDEASELSQEALEQSAGLLESILEDFGVKGEIIDVRPGPVVTMYEFEPAPGVKSSRVINLSDDIARSMSALSARVAVIPGRNVIGIELPNEERETVYLRELFESRQYMTTDFRLPLCLGKNIGGEPVVAELAKMPHLLVAGTTGSGKSVAINTMILSLLYHLRPEECRLIMVDPKMLELSVYDGIPHLLTPVVTDPKKAVLALKWAVREMEERYRKMSRLGVRNIDGFNKRVAEARASGETIMVSVPTGFDRTTGEQIFEEQELDLSALPYIVVIVDEMADLMMVAGKEIEGTIQRLAQMARAAGIHLIMATQRPSVDVITGTIKANFPTRISFQVTSKIDSRTILGEQGAEYLLGQGDMLHMKGGGRIARVHGPFVSDYEVEKVVDHLKTQGTPTYLGSVVVDEEEDEEGEEDTPVFDATEMASEGDDADELFAKAVKIVQRDKKCSTSYIQRRLSIGYNRAASLVERMEKEGLVGPANHVGKREILDTGAAG
ncbi:DNA translocase FtsK [Martelella limonii]|uniref:DNA translocase FtsK n=1 Tax=Martelella limonii TaxID=1647649 RepID=UPI00157FEFC8|nr:DNA translocase FtsK [Martelella limonii]